MAETFKNKPLREFVYLIIGSKDADCKAFKRAVLRQFPNLISRSILRQDYYEPGKKGIPLERLSAYCEVLNVDVGKYAEFCKAPDLPNVQGTMPNGGLIQVVHEGTVGRGQAPDCQCARMGQID